MPPRPPSINTLADALGLSRTTVSDALRGKGRVAGATVRRVQQAAKAAGYRPNPLVAAVLGAVNRAARPAFRGALAMLDLKEPGHPHGPFPRELVAGAKARAQEMGFSVAEFTVGEGDAALSWSRVDAILQARSTLGVIILPSWFEPDITALDWARYAGIYTDYVASGPALHSVCCEHYGSMLALLVGLTERGYRRPGLLLEQRRDERIGHRQSAAFRAFHHARGSAEFIPPLITREYPDFKTEFAPWFREHRPDVVLSHFVETRDWVRACTPAVPPGFVLLNILDRTYPCAALDLQPRILGARAAEMVVGQILRNEFGVPAWASRTTVQARFVEGPTIRPPTARRVAAIA